jgi:hypothetical protein
MRRHPSALSEAFAHAATITAHAARHVYSVLRHYRGVGSIGTDVRIFRYGQFIITPARRL